MLSKVKRKLYYLVEIHPHSDIFSRLFGYFITALVFLTIVDMALETESYIYARFHHYFDIIEVATITIFAIEYLIRLWTCNLHKNYNHKNYTHPLWGRIRFAFTPLMLIDLLSFLPFLLVYLFPAFLLIDVRFLKLLRLFRVLKLTRYFRSLKLLGKVLVFKKDELLMVFVVIMILLFVFSTLMFFVEGNAQPDKFSSISAAMWWAVITMTTVGYGDIYPITNMGKLLSGMIAILGVGIFALPAAIISTGFAQVLKTYGKKFFCPHCGKDIDDYYK